MAADERTRSASAFEMDEVFPDLRGGIEMGRNPERRRLTDPDIEDSPDMQVGKPQPPSIPARARGMQPLYMLNRPHANRALARLQAYQAARGGSAPRPTLPPDGEVFGDSSSGSAIGRRIQYVKKQSRKILLETTNPLAPKPNLDARLATTGSDLIDADVLDLNTPAGMVGAAQHTTLHRH